MIPTIEVSHLPSSTSFYAAVTQPLGIHYLCASPSSPHSVHFGIPAQPSEILFTLTETPFPKPSTITLTASNSTQVANFHTLALESNTHHSTNLIQHSPDAAVAKTTDLDGNMLEVRYARSTPRKGSVHAAPTTITTASTAKEARRVLDWQRDVARSVSAASEDEDQERAVAVIPAQAPAPAPSQAPTAPAPSVAPQPAPQPTLLRSNTAPMMTAVYNEISSVLPERMADGLSAQAIFGTILGAAAGAAVAYAMVRSEEPEPPKPQLVTYFTAPAPAPMAQPASYVEVARSKAPSYAGSRAGSRAGSNLGSQSGQRYVVRYHAPSGAGAGSVRDGYLDPVDERRSMHYSSHDYVASKAPSAASRAPSAASRAPSAVSRAPSAASRAPSAASKAPSVAPAASHVSGSKVSRHTEVRGIGHEKPMTVVSGAPTSKHSDSGRSHVSRRSDSTIKPAKASSKAGTSSRAGTERHDGTVVSIRSDRKSTTVSERARRLPLPESVVGSIAPSDSISNIGMKSHHSSR